MAEREKAYKSYPPDVRRRVLAAARAGDNWRLVAKHNGVVDVTAYGWVRAAMMADDWSGHQKPRGGSHKKLLPKHVEFLRNKLAENAELPPNEMPELLLQQFGVSVHRETIRRALADSQRDKSAGVSKMKNSALKRKLEQLREDDRHLQEEQEERGRQRAQELELRDQETEQQRAQELELRRLELAEKRAARRQELLLVLLAQGKPSSEIEALFKLVEETPTTTSSVLTDQPATNGTQ
jgi:transposase|uniref:Uncharacterized protein n=1 Tax=Globisporangium ultimum (strain ATCC 200006 / CBS 805.95 / DAOM BR144) TaxID=431595 RepID=K3WL58_GLOUD